MAKVRITQVKSLIKRPQKQKDTVRALGLRRINHSKEIETNPMVEGMIKKVEHLLKVEKL